MSPANLLQILLPDSGIACNGRPLSCVLHWHDCLFAAWFAPYTASNVFFDVFVMQTMYNCGPNKEPLPGELRAVDVVERIKVSCPHDTEYCTPRVSR